MPASITGSALQPDGSLVLANQAGAVLGDRDGRFVSINAAPLPPLNGVVPKRGGGLLALSLQGTVTANNGDVK